MGNKIFQGAARDMIAGTSGIAQFPAAAAPADGKSLAAVLRYINDTLLSLGGAYVPGFGFKVTKSENVNTATGVDLFTVTGKVLLTMWTGEVTDALNASPIDYKIRVKTSNIDLCAASNIASAAVGFMFQMCGDAGDTLINTALATETADNNGKGHAMRIVGKAGGSLTLQSNRTAGAAGDTIIHSVWYLPLEAGASIVAAP